MGGIGYAGVGGAMLAGGLVGAPVQVLFLGPESSYVFWDIGGGQFESVPLVTPGRATFQSGAIYRLKIANIPGREGVELYPTVEIAPPSRRSAAFLAHSAIPVQFTEEDLDQVLTGNFVTKVVYLPDPEFQELALAGVRTLVSTPLDPGMDPIVEADRRGAILAIIRIGNKDIELPGGAPGSGMAYQSEEGAASAVALHGSQADRGVAAADYAGSGPAAGYPAPAYATAATATGHLPSAGEPAVGSGATQMTAYGRAGAAAVAPVSTASGAMCGPDGCGPQGAYGAGAYGAGGYNASAFANYGAQMNDLQLGPGGMPAGLMAASAVPQYGMPITGTPIGLPGPPHVPLGVPAGLQKHVIHNWTQVHLPKPTETVKINVKQRPGLNYPPPANRAWIVEDTMHPSVRYSHAHFGAPPTGHEQMAPAGGLHGFFGRLHGRH
jgi:hypothetical protein